MVVNDVGLSSLEKDILSPKNSVILTNWIELPMFSINDQSYDYYTPVARGGSRGSY